MAPFGWWVYMGEQQALFRAKLNGDTAQISWQELEPFFAKGNLIWLASDLNLIDVAVDLSEDNANAIQQRMESGQIKRVDDVMANDYVERDPIFWALVLTPWVLIQEVDPERLPASSS
jgi:hypothetical protein|tara:strand:- start:4564 stop:4917 length:354 start_codon:yes stop_codon:yes gene_type:complete